jgi:DNA-binding CsgD family transcriptional regulator
MKPVKPTYLQPKIVVKDDPVRGGLYIRRSELAVVRCLVRGKGNKEVAEELNMSENTVEVHRHNILRRLECKTMVQVVHELHIAKILSEDGNNIE